MKQQTMPRHFLLSDTTLNHHIGPSSDARPSPTITDVIAKLIRSSLRYVVVVDFMRPVLGLSGKSLRIDALVELWSKEAARTRYSRLL